MQKINKTQQQIRSALLSLMSSKKFDDISVSDVAQEAQISRSTFYFYYDSKYELLEELEAELISGFLDIMLRLRNNGKDNYYNSISAGYCEFFEEYFRYIKAYFYEFKIFFDSNESTGFMSRFSRAIMQVRLKTIQLWNNYPNIEYITNNPVRIYREEILSSLYVSLFATWINRNMDLSEKEMAGMLIRLWVPLSKFK